MAGEPLRQHSNDLDRDAVDAHGLADDTTGSPELPLPGVVGDNRHRCDVRPRGLVRREEATEHRPDAEEGEVVARDRKASPRHWFPVCGNRRRHQRERTELLERRRFLPKSIEDLPGHVAQLTVHVTGYLDQPLGPRDARYRLEEKAVDDAEDRAGRGDTDGKAENCRNRKCRASCKGADREPDVLPHRVHRRPPDGVWLNNERRAGWFRIGNRCLTPYFHLPLHQPPSMMYQPPNHSSSCVGSP